MNNDIKELKGLEIFLGYNCNYGCIFCFENNLKKQEKKKTNSYILNLIKKGFIKGKKFIIFSGGEPTLYTKLPYFIAYSKKIGYKKIILHTNGSKTCNMKYLMKLYNLGLNGIVLSFHGYGIISDIITNNKKSFYYLNNSLINASKIKYFDNSFIIDTNTVINRYNVNNLLLLFKYFYKFPITRRMITLPYSMYLFKNIELQKIFPNLDTLIKEIKKVLDFSILNNIVDIVVEAVPYCFFNKKYWQFIEKNYRAKKSVYTPNLLKELNFSNEQHYLGGKIKFNECNKCVKNSICLGISKNFFMINKKLKVNPILY